MASSVTGVQPVRDTKPRSSGRRAAQPRIVIQYPSPAVDGGAFPAKRCVGDLVRVQADVFRDGHEILRAVVRHRGPGERRWSEAEMHRIDAHLDGVRWEGGFSVERTGRFEYAVEAWTDAFGTWRDELERKLAAGQRDLAGELSEGTLLLRSALEHARATDRRLIQHALDALEDPEMLEPAKHDVALGPELFEAVHRCQERRGSVVLEPPLVDRGRPAPRPLWCLV